MNTGIIGIVVVLNALVLVECTGFINRDDSSTSRRTPEVGSVDIVGRVHVCDHVYGSSDTSLRSGDSAVPGDTAAIVYRVTDVYGWLCPVCFAWGVHDIGTVQVGFIVLYTILAKIDVDIV